MKRRDFLLAAATLVAGMPHAMAQQAPTKKRIAVVISSGKAADSAADPNAKVIVDEIEASRARRLDGSVHR